MNEESEFSHSTIESAVQHLIRRLKLEPLVKEGWLDMGELTATLYRVVPEGSTDYKSYAYREISEWLWKACQNTTTPDLQSDVYNWLGKHLFCLIIQKLPGEEMLAEDLTNEVLQQIFLKISGLNSPKAFLHWAKQIAVNRLREYWRQSGSKADRGLSYPDSSGESGEGELECLVDSATPSPEKLVVQKEWISEVLFRIFNLKSTRRSRYYREILLGTYFSGLTDLELSTKLGLPAIEVQRMRYQGLALLRRDENWLEHLRECLVKEIS